MKYQGKVEFKTQPRKVWDTVLDMEQFVACFPGVEDIEMVDDKTFTGAMKAKVGPVSDKSIYDIAKGFAERVGKGEVQAKHGSEENSSTPY